MYSTDTTSEGRRAVRRLLAVACSVVVVASLVACGGSDGDAPSPYESICQVRKTCLDDEFVRTHGTVEGCAVAMKANAEVSTKRGECLQATEANFECRAENVQCRNNAVSFGGQCETEFQAQRQACRPDVMTDEEFETFCEQIRGCIGSTEFQSDFGGMQGCIDEFGSIVEPLTRDCKELASDFFYCQSDNLVCEGGMTSSPSQCDPLAEAFNMQCGTSGS